MNDMNDNNRLEDSRLDADHIDRLTRELAAMQARMQALEKVYIDATRLTLRGARTTCRSITEIVENVNGHEWNWLLESLAEVSASHTPKGTT